MKMNIEPSTSNIERRLAASRGIVRCSAFDVRCSVFLCFAVFAAPRLFSQAVTNELPALAPAYGELPPTLWERHSTMILVLGFTLIALMALLFLRKMFPPPPLVRPPEMVAREALAKLQRQTEDGNLLSEISQILRRYFSAAFGFPPGELTTAEFSAALAGSEKTGAELAQAITNFLRECDARKFSPVNLPIPFGAAARALELVDLAEKRRAQISTPK